MKLDLCIDEALSCRYHGNCICGHGYQLPLISIKLIFENISSKAEQKTMVARYQTCYTNSTEGIVYMEVSGRTSSLLQLVHDAKNHKYWTAVRHYTRYRISNTNNKLTFFQKVLVFSDGEQSFKSCLIVLFGVLLLRLDTNSSHAHGRHYRVQRSLEVEALNRLWHIRTTLQHPTYVQLQGAEFINQDITTI